jgi:hypothetical protein
MKRFVKFFLVTQFALLSFAATAQDSNRMLQYYRPPGLAGLNVFETSKTDTVGFDGIKLVVGGDFALIFQALSQENDLAGDTLVDLAGNFTLPTANLNLDVQIADGVRMHLRTYLSSRHHNEAWVKGGYFQIDKLDFIQEGFLEGIMNYTTLRFGMDEINYGDTHFRRSDNARSIYNPFVGNYIMDAFTTEPFAEVTVQNAGWLGVVGMSNGRLNQTPLQGDDGVVIYGKVGYDNYVSENTRIRLTGSFYTSSDKSTRDYLYNGDRAGGRYYNVLEGVNDARVNDFLPRFNPGFAYQTAFQLNPFVQVGGVEFFGVLERVSNGNDDTGGAYTQLGGELIYRFGGQDQLYLGGRYNRVTGEAADNAPEIEINRTNLGGGWYLTNNVLTKLEYVRGTYEGAGFANTKFQGAGFDGVVIEAVISF